jgi:hypothetical protein
MPFRRRLARSGDPGGTRRIPDGDDRLGIETVFGLDDLVLFRFRLIDVAKRALVNEREMGVVEGVLHQPKCGRVPSIIELVNAAIAGRVLFGNLGDGAQRLVESDPDIAKARGGTEEPQELALFRSCHPALGLVDL